MLSVRYILFILWFENSSNLDVMSSVVKLMMDELFLQQPTGIIESVIGGMTYILKSITLFLYITKPYWRQSTCRQFLMKCGILLYI